MSLHLHVRKRKVHTPKKTSINTPKKYPVKLEVPITDSTFVVIEELLVRLKKLESTVACLYSDNLPQKKIYVPLKYEGQSLCE